MLNRKIAVVVGVALLAVLAVASTDAWTDASQTTYVKFSRSVALPGVELTAGTYIFELADPGTSQSLVRVMSRDRRRIYTQQFTVSVQRPKNIDDQHGIAFGEAPAGVAPPIKVWYPAGQAIGHAFLYRN